MASCGECKNCTFVSFGKFGCSKNNPLFNKNCKEIDCSDFSSRYIKYPLTIKGIKNNFKAVSDGITAKAGDFVKVRPCDEEFKGKTYLGVFLGDLSSGLAISFHHDDEKLCISSLNNPAMFVPALKKIIFGYESWWSRIDSPDDLNEISDSNINSQWYVQMIKVLSKGEKP